MLMRNSARAGLSGRGQKVLLASWLAALILLAAAAAFWLFQWPSQLQAAKQDTADIAAVLIFIGTYAVIAIGKLPGSHMDRARAALLGASLMLATRRGRVLPPGAASFCEKLRGLLQETATL